MKKVILILLLVIFVMIAGCDKCPCPTCPDVDYKKLEEQLNEKKLQEHISGNEF